MKYVFLLSKENVILAKEEIFSLSEAKSFSLTDNILLVDGKVDAEFLSRRLAFTRKIFEFLFYSEKNELNEKNAEYDWEKIFKKDFCVRVENLGDILLEPDFSEKKLAGPIWRKLKKPKVKLVNSSTPIYFIFSGNRVFCCKLLHEINEQFFRRRAHKRAVMHPSSIDPKIARGLVNLTGIKDGEIADAFCGTGGILIEAGLMGIIPVGYDIDAEMIEKAKKNLDFFRVKDYKLIKKDALKISKKINYLVSDLPYGRNTKLIGGIRKLYRDFIFLLPKILVKRAVIMLPLIAGRKIGYNIMFKKSGLKIIHTFDFYVHKSLSRRAFVVIKK
jgi:tRNA (guanine10-N2)-dimethyltransferase